MDKVNPRLGSLVSIFPFNDPESAFCAYKALEILDDWHERAAVTVKTK